MRQFEKSDGATLRRGSFARLFDINRLSLHLRPLNLLAPANPVEHFREHVRPMVGSIPGRPIVA